MAAWATMADVERLEREGRFAEAFAMLAARNANDLAGLDLAGLAASEERRLDLIAAAYDREVLARRDLGSGTRAPIFIVGVPRSGSTLLEQILATHSGVQGLGETIALEAKAFVEIDWLQPRSLTPARARQISSQYLGAMRALGWRSHGKFVDKSLGNSELVGFIHLLFPRAAIVQAVRDPMDACFAAYRRNFVVQGATRFSRDLRQVGRYYVRYRRLMDYWARVLPGRVTDVIYEDLVADFPAQARRLVEACGLAWEERCLRFHENDREVFTASRDQVRRPIFTEALGRWRPYREQLAPLIDALGPYAPKVP